MTHSSVSAFVESRLPDRARKLVYLLNSRFKAYVVGGFVRDSVMLYLGYQLHEVSDDIDIAVDSTIDDYLFLLEGLDYRINREYGVVSIGNVEIASMRLERYIGGVARIYFIKDVLIDSYRRDFRFNALYFHPECGLVDTQNGLVDILKRRINFIGNPALRLQQDARRILRAVFFSIKLGFDISFHARTAISSNLHLLSCLSSEVLFDYLRDIFNLISIDFVLKNRFLMGADIGLNYRVLCYLRYLDPKISFYLGVEQYHVLLPFVQRYSLSKRERLMRRNLITGRTLCNLSTRKMKLIMIHLSINNPRLGKQHIVAILKMSIYLFVRCETDRKVFLINVLENLVWVHFRDICVSNSELISQGISHEDVSGVIQDIVTLIAHNLMRNDRNHILSFARSRIRARSL